MSSGNALFLVLVVMLPLIPAYLLYRFLPSSADVEGPWQGLKIKMGGAFAAYFVLVITLFVGASKLPAYDVWTVRGQMAFSGEGPGVFDESTVRFTVKPPGQTIDPDGSFRLTLFTVPDPSGHPELPRVIVEHPGYVPISVNLESRGTKSRLKRQVILDDTLVLKPKPADTHAHAGDGT